MPARALLYCLLNTTFPLHARWRAIACGGFLPASCRCRADVADVRLRIGDVLLVQGNREQITAFKRGVELLNLDATSDLPHSRRAPLALWIMAAIIPAAALGVLPIAISDDAQMTRGTEQLIEYRCPGKAVQRYVARICGAMLFNTSAYDWLVVSQSPLRHPPYLPLPARVLVANSTRSATAAILIVLSRSTAFPQTIVL